MNVQPSRGEIIAAHAKRVAEQNRMAQIAQEAAMSEMVQNYRKNNPLGYDRAVLEGEAMMKEYEDNVSFAISLKDETEKTVSMPDLERAKSILNQLYFGLRYDDLNDEEKKLLDKKIPEWRDKYGLDIV